VSTLVLTVNHRRRLQAEKESKDLNDYANCGVN